MSWLNIMTLLTHFFYWWKGYVFVVPKFFFFWLYIQISCVSLRSSTTLWLPYCSFRSSCKITAIVDLFERLLLRTAVHSFTHHHYQFFFLIRHLDDFFHLHHQFFLGGIFYTIHTLTEDQIVGRSFIKTGISQRDEIGFNSEVFLM